MEDKMEISESDWKKYRKNLAGWQEKYMEKLVKGYIDILSSNKEKASDKFWKLEKRIMNDRRHPGVIIETKRSTAIFDIAGLIRLKVITLDDLKDFSDELREAVKMISVR